MELPTGTAVRSYIEAQPRSLMVGRFRTDERNFFAIRAVIGGSKNPEPYMVIITPYIDNQKLPYLCQPTTSPNILDLGVNWFIDVPLTLDEPKLDNSLNSDPPTILIYSGGEYFLDIRRSGSYYLNLASGVFVQSLPDVTRLASWSKFDICFPIGNSGKKLSVFNWPEDNQVIDIE